MNPNGIIIGGRLDQLLFGKAGNSGDDTRLGNRVRQGLCEGELPRDQGICCRQAPNLLVQHVAELSRFVDVIPRAIQIHHGMVFIAVKIIGLVRGPIGPANAQVLRLIRLPICPSELVGEVCVLPVSLMPLVRHVQPDTMPSRRRLNSDLLGITRHTRDVTTAFARIDHGVGKRPCQVIDQGVRVLFGNIKNVPTESIPIEIVPLTTGLHFTMVLRTRFGSHTITRFIVRPVGIVPCHHLTISPEGYGSDRDLNRGIKKWRSGWNLVEVRVEAVRQCPSK